MASARLRRRRFRAGYMYGSFHRSGGPLLRGTTELSWRTRRAACVASIGLVGCQADPVERAPAYGGSLGGGFNGALISSGSGGEGGDPSPPLGLGGSLPRTGLVRGDILEYLGDDFSATDVHLGDVEVWGEAGRGSWVQSAAEDGEFELDGVQLATGTFLGVRPAASGAGEFLRTLSNQDTQDKRASVALVSRATINSIYETLVVPSDADLSAAQLVVGVKDAQGQNLAGVHVAVTGAELTLYASLGSWTEYSDVTTAEGRAFLGNAPAVAFPGQMTTIRLTGALVAAIRAPLAAGGVTVVNVVAGELSGAP